jgi:hypothetical protein
MYSATRPSCTRPAFPAGPAPSQAVRCFPMAWPLHSVSGMPACQSQARHGHTSVVHYCTLGQLRQCWANPGLVCTSVPEKHQGGKLALNRLLRGVVLNAKQLLHKSMHSLQWAPAEHAAGAVVLPTRSKETDRQCCTVCSGDANKGKLFAVLANGWQ